MSEALALKLEIDAKGAKKTLGDLEKASEALNDELKQTAVGSQEFKKLKSELIGVNSEIKNVELSMESLDNEQVASELGSVTGAVGDMTGAFILLGGQSKTMEEMAANIQMVIGVSMGLKGAIEGVSSARKLWNHYIKTGTALQKGSVLLTKAQGVTTAITSGIFKIFGKTVKTTSLAFKGLKAAIISSGVGLAIIAVGELISLFSDWASSEDELTEATDIFNESLERQGKILRKLREESANASKAIDRELKIRLKDIQIEIEQMKLKGASAGALHAKQMEYRAEELKAIGEQIEINKKAGDVAKEGLRIGEETIGIYDIMALKNYELVKATGALMRIDPDFNDQGLPTGARKKVLVTKQEEKDAIVAMITERQNEIKSYEEKNTVLETSLILMKKDNELADLKVKNQKKITKNTKAQTKVVEEELIILKSKAAVEIEVDNAVTENKKSNLFLVGELLAEENAKELERIKAEKQAQLDLQNAKFDLASEGLNALAELNNAFAGKSEKAQRKAFERNKKIQSAQAMISAAQGVVNILGGTSIIPEPFASVQKGVNIAILATTLAAQLKKINSAKFGGGGSGVSTPSLSGGGGGSVPTLNPISNTNTVLGQDNKVYVTETDISNTQNKVKVIEEQATF